MSTEGGHTLPGPRGLPEGATATVLTLLNNAYKKEHSLTIHQQLPDQRYHKMLRTLQ
jgi:hypothetical protein